MIETASQFGYRVFYGDASRLDLLRIAGADTAKVLVVAVDAREASLKIVQLCKQHFPHLHVSVRVADVTHAYEILDAGVTDIQREVFESSLAAAHNTLRVLGHSKEDAKATIKTFRRHNLDLLQEMHKVHKDRALLIATAKQSRADLEEQMSKDKALRSLTSAKAKANADAIANLFGLPLDK
jgi:glutathione-regulated potassium-efflux system ancillary protein KefC